jgi:hypothetical protein
MKPLMSRPPESTSIMAISSATRVTGLYDARVLPSSAIAACFVSRAAAAAMRFGDGIIVSALL